MDKKEVLDLLGKILSDMRDPSTTYDEEPAHADADEALLLFIGDDEIRAAYEAISPKWYA